MRIATLVCTFASGLLSTGFLGCGTSTAPPPTDTGPAEPDPEPSDSGEATPTETAAILESDEDAGPQVESDEPLAKIPSMPISQLLGKRRKAIETLFHPSEPGHAEGWVKYNQHLEVRYERNRCVELIQLVPGGMTCRAAARWVGFGEAMAPIYRAKSCVWPPNSIKHELGKGVSGELILEGGVFRAQLDR